MFGCRSSIDSVRKVCGSVRSMRSLSCQVRLIAKKPFGSRTGCDGVLPLMAIGCSASPTPGSADRLRSCEGFCVAISSEVAMFFGGGGLLCKLDRSAVLRPAELGWRVEVYIDAIAPTEVEIQHVVRDSLHHECRSSTATFSGRRLWCRWDCRWSSTDSRRLSLAA